MGTSFAVEGASPFGTAAIVLLLLVVVLWFVLATAAALKGSGQAARHPVAQMYGYTVCLIAVILGLTSLSSILDAAFQRAYPLQNEYGYGVSLKSFEAYKATYVRERAFGPQGEVQPDTASEPTLRRRYDALVEERLDTTSYRTSKAFITSGFLLIVSALLFLLHWRWLRRVGTA
jgi:hypothetical protein